MPATRRLFSRQKFASKKDRVPRTELRLAWAWLGARGGPATARRADDTPRVPERLDGLVGRRCEFVRRDIVVKARLKEDQAEVILTPPRIVLLFIGVGALLRQELENLGRLDFREAGCATLGGFRSAFGLRCLTRGSRAGGSYWFSDLPGPPP